MKPDAPSIPAYGLYGETGSFPDILHCERITDRAARHDWVIDPHRHAGLNQFVHVAGPRARIAIEGRQMEISRPVLLHVPRWIVHGFRFDAGTGGHVLSLPPDTLPELFGDRAEASARLSRWRMVEAGGDLGAVFEAILAELSDTRPLRDALLRARVVEIASRLVRADAAAEGDGDADGRATRHMRRFERLVRARLESGRRVEDYARDLGLSAAHLGRVCRAVTGLSAARFVEARRIQEARRQLAYTGRTVAAIAYDLGYGDPAYFSRAFRRVEGRSPTSYRAARRALPDAGATSADAPCRTR